MNKFTKNNYLVIKNVISKELTDYLYNYLLLKRQVADSFFQTNYISKHEHIHGTWNDAQVPNTYTLYCDSAMEVLLTKLKPIMEKHTALKLIETYSYARVYERGSKLEKHRDRHSCEFSTTLNLGGDHWPIFIDNKEVLLKPGDMLVYEGCKYEHWRERFDGVYCAQVFLHYADEKNNNLKYDGRPILGLPSFFKKEVK